MILPSMSCQKIWKFTQPPFNFASRLLKYSKQSSPFVFRCFIPFPVILFFSFFFLHRSHLICFNRLRYSMSNQNSLPGTPSSRNASPPIGSSSQPSNPLPNDPSSTTTPPVTTTSSSSSASSMTPVRHVSQLQPVHIKALNKEYRNQVQQASQSPENSEEQRDHFQRARRIQFLLKQYEETKKKSAGQGSTATASNSSTTTQTTATRLSSSSGSNPGTNTSESASQSRTASPSISSVQNPASTISRSQTSSPAAPNARITSSNQRQPTSQQQQQQHVRTSPGISASQQQNSTATGNNRPANQTQQSSSVSSNNTKSATPSLQYSQYRTQPSTTTKTAANNTPSPSSATSSSSSQNNTDSNVTMASGSGASSPAQLANRTSSNISRTEGLDDLFQRLNNFRTMQNEYEAKLSSVEQILKSSSNMSEAERAKFKQQELNFRTLRDQAKTSVLTVTQELQRTVPTKSYSQKTNTNPSNNASGSSATNHSTLGYNHSMNPSVPPSISTSGTHGYQYSPPGPTQGKLGPGNNSQNTAKTSTQLSKSKTAPGQPQQGAPIQRSQSYQQVNHQIKSNTPKNDLKSTGNFANNYSGSPTSNVGSSLANTNSSAASVAAANAQAQKRNLQKRNIPNLPNTPNSAGPQLKGPAGKSDLSNSSQIRRTESSPYLSTYATSQNNMKSNTGIPHTSMPGQMSTPVTSGTPSNMSKLGNTYSSMQGVNSVINNNNNNSLMNSNLNKQANKVPAGVMNKGPVMNNNRQRIPPGKISRPQIPTTFNQKRPSMSSMGSNVNLPHMGSGSSVHSYGSGSGSHNTSMGSASNINQQGNHLSNSMGMSNASSSYGSLGSVQSSAPLPLPIADKVFNKRKIHELIKDLTPEDLDGTIDNDVDDLIGDLVEEFVADVTRFTCRLAKHRKSEHLEIKDTQLHLERNWNIRVPGYLPDEVPVIKRPVPTKSYVHKLDAIALYRTFGSNPLAYGNGTNGPSSSGSFWYSGSSWMK